MTLSLTNTDWPWAETAVSPKAGSDAADPNLPEAVSQAAARCFRNADGDLLLGHLRALTLDRAVGPGVSDAALRHLEGQRALVAYLEALITRGRAGT